MVGSFPLKHLRKGIKMIDAGAIRHTWHLVPWKAGDFHTLSSDQVDQVLDAADSANYRKPKNANGSRARYFFYAIQRKLNY